jgi:hypothetical protein
VTRKGNGNSVLERSVKKIRSVTIFTGSPN